MVRRLTFRQQAKSFLKQGENRIRKPMKPATLRGFRSNLNKWLLPHLRDCVLLIGA